MLTRRHFLRTLAAGTACLGASPLLAAKSAAQPNILFIFADDQTFEGVNALGNPEVHTPNLDRLVREGVTFTHAYNMGAWHGAVCVASRTMLNTGRFLWHARDAEKQLKKQWQTQGKMWSQLMAEGGYDTYMSGKWHVKADVPSIFKHSRNVRPGMPNQTPQGYNRPLPGKPDPWKPWDKKFDGFWKGGKHWSEVLGDDAEDFLGQAAKSDKPFFMYLAFNAPHDPRQSPKEYVDRYPLDKVAVPENFLPEYPYKEKIGCGKGLRDEKLGPFPRTRHSVKVHRQEYYAIITHMDDQIGRILDALEKTGKADNTYIFFTADHGLAVGHHGLFGKQNLFDHSVRVPMMAVGPGLPKGRKISAPVYLQDVMPSALELAGVTRPDYVQFKSLMPLVRGTKAKSYDAVYGGYVNYQRMVIEGNYKLLLYPNAKKALLFNLRDDPYEMKDLTGDQAMKPTMRRLFKRLLMLQKETGDKLDLKRVFSTLAE